MIACAPAVADRRDQRVRAGHAGGERASRGRPRARRAPSRAACASGWPSASSRSRRRTRRAPSARRSRPGGSAGRRRRRTGPGSSPAWTTRVAKRRHETSDSSRSARVRMPTERPFSETVIAWPSPESSSTASRTGSPVGDARERRLHHLGDLGAHQLRVVDRVLEQAALADRADHRVRVVGGHHRQLGDAVLVQQRDRVADRLVGLDDHERRDLAGARLRAQHVADVRLAALEEPVLVHPRVVEDLAQVAAAAVGEHDRDHRLGVVDARRDLERRVHGQPARAADQQALGLGQPARREERVLVGDRHVAVDDRRVVGLGPEVLADALDEVRVDLLVGVDRADRVGADDLDRRVLLLQVARRAGDRAARADADDEVGDRAAALAPQLRARSSRSASAGWPGWRTGWAGRRPAISCVRRSATR